MFLKMVVKGKFKKKLLDKTQPGGRGCPLHACGMSLIWIEFTMEEQVCLFTRADDLCLA